jgi:hypothetical protein
VTDTETPIAVDLGPPPKIEPPPELIEAARRAIEAKQVWEFVTGQMDFRDTEADDLMMLLNV